MNINHYLEAAVHQEVMCGLSYVCGVNQIMVGVAVLAVPGLQLVEKVVQSLWTYLWFVSSKKTVTLRFL